MYEQFGFTHTADGKQSITLFVPDKSIDPTQYTRGDVSHVMSVSIISDFQHLASPADTDWDPTNALPP